MRPCPQTFSFLALSLLAACGTAPDTDQGGGEEPTSASVEAAPAEEPPPLDPAFVADLALVAEQYVQWGRVDDMWRWAPELCILQPAPQARFSESADEDTHGRKLYSLVALRPDLYAGYPVSDMLWDFEVGPYSREYDQVLVKESWKPSLATGDPDSLRTGGRGDSGLAAAERDGELWMADEPNGLFVMMRTDPATPGTDEGWVYGTIAADGETVTAAGRIASCMRCHERAPHGRLFGLPEAEHPPR